MNLFRGMSSVSDFACLTESVRRGFRISDSSCALYLVPCSLDSLFFSKNSSLSFFHFLFSCLNCSLIAALLFFFANLSKLPCDLFFMEVVCCFATVIFNCLCLPIAHRLHQYLYPCFGADVHSLYSFRGMRQRLPPFPHQAFQIWQSQWDCIR